MSNVVWRKPDGTVSISNILDNIHPDVFAEDSQVSGSFPSDWVYVGKNISIPSDQYCFDAFGFNEDTKQIYVIKDKAVEITKKRLRNERQPLMYELDIAYMKADEQGNIDEKHRVVTEKNRLRDITNLVTNDLTLEEMEALTCSK